MLKKDWKKNILRMKQTVDQNIGRADKSEVLSENFVNNEKRVEGIKQACKVTQNKLSSCMQQSGPDYEKRLKKMPEALLSQSFADSAEQLGSETNLGSIFRLCGDTTYNLARARLDCELEIEEKVLGPFHTITENDVPAIQRLKKTLNRLTLDMDSAKSRFQSASHQGSNTAKIEQARDEMDDAASKMKTCRDQYTTDLMKFLSKETEYSKHLFDLLQSEFEYHRRAATIIECALPGLQEILDTTSVSPIFGTTLDDHLERSNREISAVIEICVCTLLDYGLEEEGLLRIAGAASRVKKLRASFDSMGDERFDMEEYIRDIHCVSGCLKQYLRDLKEPLMTFELHDDWIAAAHQPSDQRLQALWMVLDRMPKSNYNNLRYLIKFLAKIVENSEINKMTPSNIAIIMGPNLFRSQGDEGPTVLSTGTQSGIIEALISNVDYFFPGEIEFSSTSPRSGSMASVDSANYFSDTSKPAYAIQPNLASPVTISVSSTSETLLAATGSPMGSQGSLDNIPSMSPSAGLQHSVNANGPAVSPKIPRRGTKKPAPPPPPAVPERPVIVEKSSAVDVPASPDKPPGHEKPPKPDRPNVIVIPLSSSDGEKPNSPRHERPRVPPPERPSKPEVPPPPIQRQSSGKPPRPSVPPPPVGDHQRKPSQDKTFTDTPPSPAKPQDSPTAEDTYL